MSSPSPESVSLLQSSGNSSPSSPLPARDPPFDFGEESARSELSPEPHSPSPTAALEREVEQLKADVAHWKGHCLDAEMQVTESCFRFRELRERLIQHVRDFKLAAREAQRKREKAESESQEIL